MTGVVGLLTGQGKYVQAAHLFGALESRRASMGLVLPPADCADYEQSTNASRAALSEPDFRAAWKAGRAPSLEHAAKYAMEELNRIYENIG